MRDYGRVAPTFWTRGSGKKLRGNPSAQIVALYLFTSPASTMIGIYHLAIPTMAHETGLTVAQATRALEEVCALGIAEYDADAELVYLPEGAKYQIGETLKPGDKRARGIEGALAQLNGHPFAEGFIKRYAADFSITPQEGASKGHPCPTGRGFEARQGSGKDQVQAKQEERNAVSNPPPSGSGLSSDIGPELTTASACCPETPSAPTTECPTGHAPVPRAQPPVQLALVPTADPSPSAALVAPRPEPDAEGTTATPDATEPASAKHDPVAAIFSEYIAGWKRQTKGRRAPVLDAKRRKLTLDRLKTFSEEDLKSAARGIWKHPWNLENQQTSYDLAMRDSAHVEKFMAADEASKPQPARGGIPEWLDTGRPSDRLVAYMKSPEYKPTPTNIDIAALLASVGPAEMQ